MKHFHIVILTIATIVTFSCRKDFSTVPSYGNLTFSKDTVFLDTIFTNIGSSTYNLKVYNNSKDDITIPEITLENGENSNYRLNIDGIPGKSFSDIDVLANDSLFVFIETTIDFDEISDPLYTDKILFDNGNNQQNVDLVTLVQDATFIFPSKNELNEIETITFDEETIIQGRYLNDDELTFTNEKPYVIYGYAAVASNKTLTIEAGTRLFFHNNSGLIIDTGASLKVNGTVDEKVTFQGDRLEHFFEGIPAQWGTIWLRQGSIDHEINHTQIKNSTTGILINGTSTTTTLKIENSEIYNASNYGILAREANIEGNNLVIGNAGLNSLASTTRGTYNFTHCTFANYWTEDTRTSPAVSFNNSFSLFGEDEEIANNSSEINFINCIIEGNNNIEFLITSDEETVLNYNINNSLIKFNDISGIHDDNSIMDFNNTEHYQDNIFNGIPDFKDTTKNEFLIGVNSDAIDKAISTEISTDILNTSRTPTIDIGAYQHTTFEEEE